MDSVVTPDGYGLVNPEDVSVGDTVFAIPGAGAGLAGPLDVERVDGVLYGVSPDHTIRLADAGVTVYGKPGETVVETHQEWDATARVVRTVTNDEVLLNTRPFNADENATADAQLAAAAADAAIATISSALVTALGDLQNILNTPDATLNASPAGAIKTLARAQRRVIRLAVRKLDSTS